MNNPSPKSGILSISPYQAGKSQAGKAATRIIKLSSNENALGSSPLAVAAIKEHLATLHRYPDSGSLGLRETIAKTYYLEASQIVCGNGSDELIGLLVHAFAGEGDEVLFSEYGFLMYQIYTLAAGATPVKAREDNLRTSVENLLAGVTQRTKIVFIANPNNPTGSYITKAELQYLRDKLPAHILLVVDAAYSEYVEIADYSDGLELVKATQNTVMLRTFSKIYGLAALRLGWAYGSAFVADILNRVRGPFNVSALAQIAGIAALQDTDFLEKSRSHNHTWLAWVSAEISKLGLKVHESIGNFVLVEFPTTAKNAKAACAFLMEHGIIPREVGGYGLPNHLRITIGEQTENEALIETLKTFMQA